MIIIFSNHADLSTDQVVDYLITLKVKFVRVNSEDVYDFIQNIQLNKLGTNIEFQFGCEQFSIKDVEAVWFRRGGFSYSCSGVDFIIKNEGMTHNVPEDIAIKLRQNLIDEYQTVYEFVMDLLQQQARVLGNWRSNKENKLTILHFAQLLGLNIPDTFVSKFPRHVIESNSSRKNREYITKPLCYTPAFVDESKEPISVFTEIVSSHIRSETKLNSLVQQKIEKELEIRSFYLDEKFYSMAILSQKNSKTETDFRNYDYENPNRYAPYKLPLEIETKLRRLIEKVQLNTCSFDMILDKSGKYWFLEINPSGQFGFVSNSCNYNLEKEIVKFLTKSISYEK